MPVTQFPLIDSKIPPSINVFYFDSGLAFFAVPSNPEGNVAANPGSLAIDVVTGNWYRKNSGTGNTGWLLSSGSGTLSNVVRTINRNFTPTGNVGAGLDVLHSFTLDTPNRLLTNGDLVTGNFGGILATNDNNKRLVIQFGGATVFDSALQDFDGAADRNQWSLQTTIARVSATTVNAVTQVQIGQFFADGAGTFVSTNGMDRGSIVVALAVPDMTANPTVFQILAEGVANDDIVQHTSIIELVLQ